MVPSQKQTHRSIEQNRKTKNKPLLIWLIFDRAKEYIIRKKPLKKMVLENQSAT